MIKVYESMLFSYSKWFRTLSLIVIIWYVNKMPLINLVRKPHMKRCLAWWPLTLSVSFCHLKRQNCLIYFIGDYIYTRCLIRPYTPKSFRYWLFSCLKNTYLLLLTNHIFYKRFFRHESSFYRLILLWETKYNDILFTKPFTLTLIWETLTSLGRYFKVTIMKLKYSVNVLLDGLRPSKNCSPPISKLGTQWIFILKVIKR